MGSVQSTTQSLSTEKSHRARRLSRAWTMPSPPKSTQATPRYGMKKILHRLTSYGWSDKQKAEPQGKRQRRCERSKSSTFDFYEKKSDGLPLLLNDEFPNATLVWNRKEWLRVATGVSSKVKKVFRCGLPLIYANPEVFGRLINQNFKLPKGYHTQEEFDEFMSEHSHSFPYWSMDKDGWCIIMDKKMVEKAKEQTKEQVLDTSKTQELAAEQPLVELPDTPVRKKKDSRSSVDSFKTSSPDFITYHEVPNKLDRFELKGPPNGDRTVVFYFTSLQGIRKTYESCKTMQRILDGLLIHIDERDVSRHAEFRKELEDMFGKVVVPSLFIKGRYIGGAEEVGELNETGELKELVLNMPKRKAEPCSVCGGERFIPCVVCSGSRKVVGDDKTFTRCSSCNENGLMRCPSCC